MYVFCLGFCPFGAFDETIERLGEMCREPHARARGNLFDKRVMSPRVRWWAAYNQILHRA
jgi:hypothetical protein